MSSLDRKVPGRLAGKVRFRPARQFRPWLERLDQRLALSGASASLAAANLPPQVMAVVPIRNPYLGTSMVSDPAASPAFEVHFSRSIDATLLMGNDFTLYALDADGSTRSPQPAATRYLESGNPLDKTSSSILVSFTAPLPAGSYQLVLSKDSQLSGMTDAAGNPADQLVERFTVGSQALADGPTYAIDDLDPLRTLQLPVVANDLAGPASELDLAAGTTWTITPDFGRADPDDFRLALFDGQGQLILTTPGSDLTALGTSLPGGRYFLQVYQTGMTDGTAPASIPVTVAGTRPSSASVGASSITPLNGNGLDRNADSLLIQFGGPDDVRSLAAAGSTFTLVDGSGRVWSASAAGSDPASGRLLLRLPGYLPTGRYSLQATAATASTQVRQLGTFDTTLQPSAPGDLGTIFAGSDDMSWRNATTVLPGQSSSQDFSVLESHTFTIRLSNPDLSGQLVRLTRDASGQLVGQVISSNLGTNLILGPGIYRIIAQNATATGQPVAFAVIPKDLSHDSLSIGGVGQIPANLNQSTLLYNNSPAATTNQHFAAAPTVTMAGGGGQPDPVAASPRGTEPWGARSVELPGSFGVTLFVQAPLGSFSGATSTSASAPGSSAGSEAAPPNDALSGVIQSTIFLNAHPTTTRPSSRSSRDPARIAPEVAPVWAEPSVVPETYSTVASGASSAPDRPDARGRMPLDPEVVAAAALGLMDAPTAPTLAEIDADPQADLAAALPTEPSVVGVELADLTSPIGVLVAVSVAARWFKATPVGAGLLDQSLIKRICRRGLDWFAGRKVARRLGW